MDETVDLLLGRKQNDAAEIEIHFFEFCNLNCSFCGQDHDSTVGMNTIVDKADNVCRFMSKNNKKEFIINSMGGEIFNDLVDDKLFADYEEFATRVNKHAKAIGKTCHFNWVTNLVFTKKDRVRKLIDRLRAKGIENEISTSYDFTGRPLAEIRKGQFYSNLQFFKEEIYTIGFVLTKPSIRNMLRDKDEFFKHLYQEGYTLYFDYYVPEKRSANTLMPSDRDQLQAFLFIAEHYPKVFPIADWINNVENKLTCFSTNKVTILQDGREVTCRYLQYKDGDFKSKVDYNSNSNIIHNWVQEKECMSCEYYGRCSLTCFVQADWTEKETMDICLYKTLYKTLDEWKAVGYGPYNKTDREM